MRLSSRDFQQDVEAQVVGIGQLCQHQQALHGKLLAQLSLFSDLQQEVASIAVGCLGLPRSPILTLRASLEAASHMEGVRLSSGSESWTAADLLALFQRRQPLSLQMRVSLVKPNASWDGAIYEVGSRGEVIADTPLFCIERPRAPERPLRTR
jgi:hypothetical protein